MSKLQSAVDVVINTIGANLNITFSPPPLDKNGGVAVILDSSDTISRSLNFTHAKETATMLIYSKADTSESAMDVLARINEYISQSTLEEFVSNEVQIIRLQTNNGVRLTERHGDDWIYQLQFTITYFY